MEFFPLNGKSLWTKQLMTVFRNSYQVPLELVALKLSSTALKGICN